MTNKNRILITGAAGLIGRLCFNHLRENTSHEVWGCDIHRDRSLRFELENQPDIPLLPLPEENFFIADITNKEAIAQLIKEKK